jgi:hypothetical protein
LIIINESILKIDHHHSFFYKQFAVGQIKNQILQTKDTATLFYGLSAFELRA